MIADLMGEATRIGTQADAVIKSDETTSLRFHNGVLQEAHTTEESGANLRLVAEGRIGVAGSTMADPAALARAALDSTRLGRSGPLFYPASAPFPEPATCDSDAVAAGLDDLKLMGLCLGDSLVDDRTSIAVTLERSVGRVRVANSRGVEADYLLSGVAIYAIATRVMAGGPVAAHSWWGATALPTDEDLAAMVEDLSRRLDWATEAAPAPAPAPAPGPGSNGVVVCFTPRAVATLLMPVRRALGGKALVHGDSPLADRLGIRVFAEGFSLIDDPLIDGRPGSRPVDDEGVVSRRLALVSRGVVEAGIFDLESGALGGVPSTGHARRTTFGKPQAAYSNLQVLPGEHDWEALLGLVGDGLVVDRLAGPPRFSRQGAYRVPVELAWRVAGGELTGRVGGVTIAGNVFQQLGRIRGFGRETTWLGSMALPAMVVEGVALSA